jgi:hypothetical protein
MTNRRKEIPMRYSSGADRAINEISISEDDTVRAVLLRLKPGSNFHLADVNDKPFGIDDYPFGYVSIAANPPLQILHGSALKGKKRDPTPKKDNRIATEIRFRDLKTVFARGVQPTYAKALTDAISSFSITDPCHIERVRAEDDRIIIEIALGEDAPWFTEKSCPPLKLSEDKIYAESTGTGGWGITPPPPPMQTRAKATKAKRFVDVLLHNLGTDEIENVGKAAEYNEAIALANRSGKVPKGWNVAVTDANEE